VYEEVKDCKRYNGSELQFILFGAIPHMLKDIEELNTKYNNLKIVCDNLQTNYDDLLNRMLIL
jgi:hypothetical protein